MRKKITAFFDYLSERIYKENNLSDITWALCNASEEFKRLFLNYCFGEETPEMQVFEREEDSNDSRPDFYCEDMEKNVWIIEVKIGNRNEKQLPQYRKEFKNAKIAFIANYDASALCKKELDISIKTWKGFIGHLLESTKDELIIGYSKYLKKITRYLEVNEMNLNLIKSLPDFNGVLESIVQEYSEKGVKLSSSPSSSKDWYGRNISYINKSGKTVKFWAGIEFFNDTDKCSLFFIEFILGNRDRVPKNEAENIKNLENKEGEYLCQPYFWGSDAYFYIKDEPYNILFSKKPEIEKQKEVIRNSIHEVLSYLL
jgi:hypothetical protein